jgi:Co/Zn/Cd efflux system component
MRQGSDNGFLGYAVHSLALVADSFHMVRYHSTILQFG